jgi:hypothetical protein
MYVCNVGGRWKKSEGESESESELTPFALCETFCRNNKEVLHSIHILQPQQALILEGSRMAEMEDGTMERQLWERERERRTPGKTPDCRKPAKWLTP